MRYSMLLAACLASATTGSVLAAPVTKKAPADDESKDGLGNDPQLSVGVGYLSSYMTVGNLSVYAMYSPKLALGFSATMGSQIAFGKHVSEDDQTTYSSFASLNEIAAKARYFLVESLYVSGGLGVRTTQTQYTLDNDSGSSSRVYMMRSYVPSLSVGSQWRLGSSMVFGIEWAGYEWPLAAQRGSTGKTEIPPNDAADTNNPRNIAIRNRADKLGKQPNWILGLVSVGWLF